MHRNATPWFQQLTACMKSLGFQFKEKWYFQHSKNGTQIAPPGWLEEGSVRFYDGTRHYSVRLRQDGTVNPTRLKEYCKRVIRWERKLAAEAKVEREAREARQVSFC